MPGSSSCVRCRQPLAVDSASGLCDICSRALETSRPQATPPSTDNDSTRNHFESPDAATLTAGFDVDHPTAAWTKPARMRPSPPGHDLIRYIDGGGMGEVYVGREHFAQRIVAVKFLRATGNPTLRDRFLREIKTLGQVEHSNIVRIISVDVERNDPYFTMEYGAGGTIADRIKAEGPYSPEAAARIGIQLASALTAVHRAGIYHRDLKPSNVVLTADGTPKLSDFGLAKLMDEDDELTRTTQAIGTPAFMPPEQISRKLGQYSPPTDVYGLGATLYAMLTGKAPFTGDSNDEILLKVKSDDPIRARVHRPDLPMGLEAVVMKCLEKRPADRYATADDLAKDLERCLTGRQDVRPRTWWRRSRRWAVRHASSIAVGVCLVVMVGAVGQLVRSSFAASEPHDPGEEATPITPLQRMENDIRAGRPVRIAGTGLPMWSEWLFGGSTLVPSDVWTDGTVCFLSGKPSFLSLIRDPLSEHFRFEAELCHESSQSLDGSAGIFVGYELIAGPNGQSVRRFQTMEFSEYWGADEEAFPKFKSRHALFIRDRVYSHEANGAATFPPMRSLSFIEFQPSLGNHRWRKVVVEADRGEMVFSWQGDDAAEPDPAKRKPRTIKKTLKASVLDEVGQAQQRELDARLKPDQRVQLGAWTSRRPIGIYSQGSVVAFRNVVFTPLDKEPAP